MSFHNQSTSVVGLQYWIMQAGAKFALLAHYGCPVSEHGRRPGIAQAD